MQWEEYELLDSGMGRKLERFGPYILSRPDPQIIWQRAHPELWSKAQATYERNSADRGIWKGNIPSSWNMQYQQLTIEARLTPFKHTGVFPEQVEQWEWMTKQIKLAKRQLSVLNLFGYTGMAALVSGVAGAKVTYVDASKAAVTWARKNQELSKVAELPIRWILDDVVKFVTREVKRGVKYDAIIMDPPVFGHGPEGETWQFNKSLPQLIQLLTQVLSDQPAFVLINAYAVSTSAFTLGNLLQDLLVGHHGEINTGELVLSQPGSPRVLSTGIWGSWQVKG